MRVAQLLLLLALLIFAVGYADARKKTAKRAATTTAADAAPSATATTTTRAAAAGDKTTATDASSTCFLNYDVGETHVYEYNGDGEFSTWHATATGDEHTETQHYTVHMRNKLTLLARIGDLLYFELDVESARWDDAAAQFDFHGKKPKIDAAFSATAARWPVYFTQTCAGEITRVAVADKDDRVVTNMKMQFLRTVSRRMSDDKAARHEETHHDQHGPYVAAYKYKQKRGVDAALHVSHGFDRVHEHDLEASGTSAPLSIRMRTAMHHDAVYRNGVLHEVATTQAFNLPHKEDADVTTSTRRVRRAHRGTHAESVDALEADKHTQSFAMHGTGTLSVRHTGDVHRAPSKREAARRATRDLLAGKKLAEWASAHAQRQYASRAGDDALAPQPIPLARSRQTLDEALATLSAAIDGGEAAARRRSAAASNLVLLLRATDDNARELERRYLSVDALAAAPRPTREAVFDALGEAQTDAAQAVLVRVVDEPLHSASVRMDAMLGAQYVNAPSRALVDALARAMPDVERLRATATFKEKAADVEAGDWRVLGSPRVRSATPTGVVELRPLERQALLVYGAVAHTVRARVGDTERAWRMRAELYERLMAARIADHQQLVSLAIQNALDTDAEDHMEAILAWIAAKHGVTDEHLERAKQKRATAVAASAAAGVPRSGAGVRGATPLLNERVSAAQGAPVRAKARVQDVLAAVQHRKRQIDSRCTPLPDIFPTYKECIENISRLDSFNGIGAQGDTENPFDFVAYLEKVKAINLVNQCGPWDEQGDDSMADGFATQDWFVSQFACMPDKAYREVRPPNLTEAELLGMTGNPNTLKWRHWEDSWKFGKEPLYAELEAIMSMRPNYYPVNEGGIDYWAHLIFVGGIVEVNMFNQRIHVVSAYIRITAKTVANGNQGLSQEEAYCGTTRFELYFAFRGKTFYMDTGDVVPGCVPAYQTCFSFNKPLDYTDSTTLHKTVVFFDKKWNVPINLGGFDIEAGIKGTGEATFHFSPPMFFTSKWEGGTLINVYAEPEALARISAHAKVVWKPDQAEEGQATEEKAFQWTDLIGSVELELRLEIVLLQMSFPVSMAFNFDNVLGAARVNIMSQALGGKITIILRISFLPELSMDLWEWKPPFQVDNPLLTIPCCEFCDGSCFDNARCNFADGTCICFPGWDGPRCDIPCPVKPEQVCEDHAIGVECWENEEGTLRCKCDAGSWGWGCKDECLPNRANPCSGHGTCDDRGLCTCDPFYYGPGCDHVCPPDADKDNSQPLNERCGGAEKGYCYWDGSFAQCECYYGFIGPECDKLCPNTDDHRAYTCSLRGQCTEVDGVAQCLCEVGFYGDTCEFIDYEGSGRALFFPGTEENEADFILPVPTVAVDASLQPVTSIAWIKLDALPTQRATVLKWKYGLLAVEPSGALSGCDPLGGACATLTDLLTTTQWYHVGMAYQRTAEDGQLSVYAYPFPGNTDDRASATYTGQLGGSDDVHLKLGAFFNGKIDTVVCLDHLATAGEWLLHRSHGVMPDTAGIMIYMLADFGRGYTEYLEQPFGWGALGDDVRWANSEVLLEKATVNSGEPVAEMQFYTGNVDREKDYYVPFSGRKLLSGAMEFTLIKEGATPCNVRLTRVNIEIWLQEASGLVCGEVSAAVGRNVITLSQACLESLVDGANTFLWEIVTGGAECAPASDNPLRIDYSFVTIETHTADGYLEFAGVPSGFMQADNAVGPMTGNGEFAIEMWALRSHAATSTALLMAVTSADESTPPEISNSAFLMYEQGYSGKGIQFQYEHSQTATFDNKVQLPYYTPNGTWFHIVFTMKLEDSKCKHRVLINGVESTAWVSPGGSNPDPTPEEEEKGFPQSACALASPRIYKWANDAAMKLQVGRGPGEVAIDDVIIWGQNRYDPYVVRKSMYLWRDWADTGVTGQWLSAWNFNEESNLEFQAVGTSAQLGASTVAAYRGLKHGLQWKWRSCPGTTDRYPEFVCSSDLNGERGRCSIEEDNKNEGYLYVCRCHYGYAGFSCQLECPGGAANPCNGHGTCVTTNDTHCVCDTGFVGDACQYLCPGFLDPLNLEGRVCSGYGRCQVRQANSTSQSVDLGAGAECVCDAEAGRYGAYCQYEQGKDPIRAGGCAQCVGPHQYCHEEENVCLCEETFYMVGGDCVGAAASLVVNALALLLVVIVSIVFM